METIVLFLATIFVVLSGFILSVNVLVLLVIVPLISISLKREALLSPLEFNIDWHHLENNLQVTL